MINVTDVLKVAKELYELSQAATVNKKQAKLLARRVKNLMKIIKSHEARLNNDFNRSLSALSDSLQKAINFIREYSNPGFINSASRFIKAKSIKEDFEEINKEIQAHISDLALGINVETYFNEMDDIKAFKEDMEALLMQLPEIIANQVNEENKRTFNEFKEDIRKLLSENSVNEDTIIFKGPIGNDSKRTMSEIHFGERRFAEGATSTDMKNMDALSRATMVAMMDMSERRDAHRRKHKIKTKTIFESMQGDRCEEIIAPVSGAAVIMAPRESFEQNQMHNKPPASSTAAPFSTSADRITAAASDTNISAGQYSAVALIGQERDKRTPRASSSTELSSDDEYLYSSGMEI